MVELSEWHMWWKQRGARGIRRILMEEWDPLGVDGVPEATDEYDSYLSQVSKRLREGASEDELASYLRWVAEDRMGLGPPVVPGPDAEQAVAAQLIRWYAEEMRTAQAD